MSAIKKGDKARATCGGSVIVGKVTRQYDEGLAIYVDGDTNRYFPFRAWTFEVIAPPIPDVVGTILWTPEVSA